MKLIVHKIKEIFFEKIAGEEKKILQNQKKELDLEFYKYFLFLYPFLYVLFQSASYGGKNELNYPFAVLFTVGVFLSFLTKKSERIAAHINTILYCQSFVTIGVVYANLFGKPVDHESIFTVTGILILIMFLQTFRLRSWPSLFLFIPGLLLHNMLLFQLTNSSSGIVFQTNLILFVSFLLSITVVFNRKEKTIESIHLHRERWIMNNDLKIARAVQDSLFPKPVEFPGKIKYELYRKAHIQIGGDFFDFIQLREGNMGIFFTDVAGHGISASMVAAILKVLVSTIPYEMKLYPEKLLGYLDTVLEKDLNHYHASAIYMFLDFIERKIRLGNAGHPYLLHSPQKKPFRRILTEGALMGFGIKNPLVTVKELSMEKGDRYFFYTDGLTESENDNEDYLGEKGLLSLLNRHNDAPDIGSLKKGIMDELTKFFDKKSFGDDVMFLILEID